MERGSAGQLLAVNTFVWVTTALYAPFIGAYYAEQGITPFQVGVLTAIGPVVSTLIQPLWAYISDRLGKRRRVLIIVTIGSGLTILTYLLHVSFHAFVAATLCFTVFQTSILPLADALVTQEAARQKANFAKIRMGGTTGYAITALVLGNFFESPTGINLCFRKLRFLSADIFSPAASGRYWASFQQGKRYPARAGGCR